MNVRGMLSGLGQGLNQVGSQWNKQAASAAAQEKLRAFQAKQASDSRAHSVAMQGNSQDFSAGQGLLARQHAGQMQVNSQTFQAGENQADRENSAQQGVLSRQHQVDTANPTVVTTVDDKGQTQQLYKSGKKIGEHTLSASAMANKKGKDSKPVWDDQQVAKEARAAVRQWSGVESGMVDFDKDMQAETTDVQARLEALAKQQAKKTSGAEVDMSALLQQAVADVRGQADKQKKVSSAVQELGEFGARLAPARYASELADRGLDLPDIVDAMHSNNKVNKNDPRAMAELFRDLGFSPEQSKQALAQMGIK